MNTQQPKRRRGTTGTPIPPQEEPPLREQTPIALQKSLRRSPRHVVPTSERCSFLFEHPGNLFRICTSGYTYKFWHTEGSFYGNVPEKYEFQYYASEFDTVELNATFYRWFNESIFDGWRHKADAIRPSFQYVIKAHQYYTHMKRLNVDEKFKSSWNRFWACCQRLGQHLGPVLFQFPESFHMTSTYLSRLEDLGAVLDPNGKFVFEFRHISWFSNPQVNELLKRYNWCLAIADVSGMKKKWASTLLKGPNPRIEDYPLDCCTWGAYVRFHGAIGQYVGAYGPEKMAEWAKTFSEWIKKTSTSANGGTSNPLSTSSNSERRVYAAFNNTDDGRPASAIADARSLAEGLRALGYV